MPIDQTKINNQMYFKYFVLHVYFISPKDIAWNEYWPVHTVGKINARIGVRD